MQQEIVYDRTEEYRAARRAGAEAVEIGRETLEETTRQGEQLEHAEKMADETSYKLDKAGRVLRGMTWSGWVANKFAKDLNPPGTEDDSSNRRGSSTIIMPAVYDDVPSTCREAAQAIQNYNANLKILSTCEDQEQEETCHIILENMYQVAKKEVDKLVQTITTTGADDSAMDTAAIMIENQTFIMRLQKDLGNLRSRQDIQRRSLAREQKESQQAANYESKREQLLELGDTAESTNDNKNYDKSSHLVDVTDPRSPETRAIMQQQDDHLDHLAQNLGELGSIALHLSEATERQSAQVDMLDTKAENVLDQSRMVTRRSDRLVQQKKWSKAKPTFHSFISIQHKSTNKYLAVSKGCLVLRSVFDEETCAFGLWKRQGSIFGLQSRFSRKWVGQSLFGNLDCNAASFGWRQEFEVRLFVVLLCIIFALVSIQSAVSAKISWKILSFP